MNKRALRTIHGTLGSEVKVMARKRSAFDGFVREQLKSPSFAAEYKRAGAEIRAIDDFIREVEAARLELGMTKADLARKVSTTPEAMRRLLTSGDANPTLHTVLHVLEAVGLRFTLTPKRSEQGSRASAKSQRERRSA